MLEQVTVDLIEGTKDAWLNNRAFQRVFTTYLAAVMMAQPPMLKTPQYLDTMHGLYCRLHEPAAQPSG